ncbi:hypothetical protein [Halobaculum marinum]|uniref:Zinc-ribbon domain-containing protein n=1 Tax=Halobaculum marinum TaxID=3031996 RepID=A0ABD5WYT2_9EURY|nr:hypothetical protein [Halobaculum sp. DT55]
MTDRMHPLTAVGVGLVVGAFALAVGGVRGLAVAGVLVGVGGLWAGAGSTPHTSGGPDECPHCGIRNPGTPTCRWCDEAVTEAADAGTDEDETARA